MKNKMYLLIVGLIVGGCASTKQSTESGRKVTDATKIRSEWVDRPELVWEADGKYYGKAMHTVRGDQQVNGCYDLAKLNARENLISEISNEVKGTIDNAQTSISEDAEIILGKARSGRWEGTIFGMKTAQQYFERYLINGTERIDCSVLTELSKQDYEKTKHSVVDKMVAEDSRLKEAIIKKQIDFFSDSKGRAESKKVASPTEQ